MQTIRTSFNQKYPTDPSTSIWTIIRLAVTPFIDANADAFEAMTRMGQPFGGSITSRR